MAGMFGYADPFGGPSLAGLGGIGPGISQDDYLRYQQTAARQNAVAQMSATNARNVETYANRPPSEPEPNPVLLLCSS